MQSQSTNQHSNSHHGRSQNTHSSICILEFWLILMTPSIVSLAVIWHWQIYRTKKVVLVLTRVESEGSTVKSVVEKFNTQVSSFLKKFEATVRCCTQKQDQRKPAYCPLPYLASRNSRHHCSQEQQRNRR